MRKDWHFRYGIFCGFCSTGFLFGNTRKTGASLETKQAFYDSKQIIYSKNVHTKFVGQEIILDICSSLGKVGLFFWSLFAMTNNPFEKD